MMYSILRSCMCYFNPRQSSYVQFCMTILVTLGSSIENNHTIQTEKACQFFFVVSYTFSNKKNKGCCVRALVSSTFSLVYCTLNTTLVLSAASQPIQHVESVAEQENTEWLINELKGFSHLILHSKSTNCTSTTSWSSTISEVWPNITMIKKRPALYDGL